MPRSDNQIVNDAHVSRLVSGYRPQLYRPIRNNIRHSRVEIRNNRYDRSWGKGSSRPLTLGSFLSPWSY